MALNYFDISGLAKRYLSERGSGWVHTMIAIEDVMISELSITEIASIFARKVRESRVTSEQAARLFTIFQQHRNTYQIVPLTLEIVEAAAVLLRAAPPNLFLRALDAIHIVRAQQVFAEAQRYGFSTGEFITADRNLLAAAAWAGFAVLYPEDFP